MMSSNQKGSHAPRRFKWQWRSESSMTSPLITDTPPEIELSDYRRLPSSGSESPSGLLHGEGVTAEPITDLDLFFGRLYNYYCEKGLWCIITKWIVETLTVIFVVCFIGFFLLVVDWHALRNVKCGVDAVESGQKPCDLAKEAIKSHPLVPFTLAKGVVIGSMVILVIYGLFNSLKFFVQLKDILSIRHFYYNSLSVTDRELQTTPWPSIVEKVVHLQTSQRLCVVKDLTIHDVVMRIMRKDNYLIGMLNKGVLAFPIPWWVPGAGPAVNSKADRRKNHLILTKTLEWTLNWCIFQNMFDSKFHVQSDFIASTSLLRWRLLVVGIGMLIISPCLVIFMLVYLFLRHAEQIYNQPKIAFFRRWSNLSKWIFREFNEVDHLFKHRLDNSVVHASDYLMQFQSPLISIIAKFISFVSGGLLAVLIIIAVLDESLVEGHIFGHKLVWYGLVFTTVAAVSRGMVPTELQVRDPGGEMSLVVQQTHYMPKRWRGKENSDPVRAEFETLFQYTGMMLLEEMASIFITPCLLIFVVPKRAGEILRFISDFTVDIEGVGHVCSLSVFNFQSHGNKKYASPHNATREQRSSQGKMEKSFLSFQSTYPSWVPDLQGQQFLSTLSNFRQRQLCPELHEHLPTGKRYHARDILHDNGVARLTGYHLGPLWLSNPDQRPHPYLLDWYYTSQPPQPVEIITAPPTLSNLDASEAKRRNSSQAHNIPHSELQHDSRRHSAIEHDEDIWGSHISERMHSHFEASTSNLRNDLPCHLNPEHQPVKHWWARPVPRLSVQQASFLEPSATVFGRPNLSHHSEDGSDESVDCEEGGDHGGGEWKAFHSLPKRTYPGSRSQSSAQQASFLQPPAYDHHNFSHHSDDVMDQRLEGQQEGDIAGGEWKDHTLPMMTYVDNASPSSTQHASFLEPVFSRHSFSRHTDDDGSPERGDIGGRDWNNFPTLSKTTYIGDSDNDEGFGLHFANDSRQDEGSNHTVSSIFDAPPSIPVRIIPRSNDPIHNDRLQ